MIGRIKPGRYPLWGVYYFRWWLVQPHSRPDPHQMVPGLAAACASTCGRSARKSATTANHLRDRLRRDRSDLDRRGNDHRLESQIVQRDFEGAEIVIGPIEIGPDGYIGSSCVIEEDVVLEEGAELRDLTAIAPHNGSPPGRSGMVRPAAASARWTAPSSRALRRISQRKRVFRASFILAAAGDPAGRSVADVSGVLGVRPDRRFGRPRRHRPHALHGGDSGHGLADGLCHGAGDGRPSSPRALDRAAPRARRDLFGLSWFYHAQMGGGPGDRR